MKTVKHKAALAVLTWLLLVVAGQSHAAIEAPNLQLKDDGSGVSLFGDNLTISGFAPLIFTDNAGGFVNLDSPLAFTLTADLAQSTGDLVVGAGSLVASFSNFSVFDSGSSVILNASGVFSAGSRMDDYIPIVGDSWDLVFTIGGGFSDPNSVIGNIDGLTFIPLPAAAWLFGTALIGLWGYRKVKA